MAETKSELVATIGGLVVKKMETSKKKVRIVFEGKLEDITTVGKTLSDSLRELNTASMNELFANLAISVSEPPSEEE